MQLRCLTQPFKHVVAASCLAGAFSAPCRADAPFAATVADSLEAFEAAASEASAEAVRRWTSICNYIGATVPVTIQVLINGYPRTISRYMTVGDPADRCPGRCGASCGSVAYRQIYTLECLEHDLCEHTFGTSTGVCMDLMVVASDSFINGAKCH